MGFRYTDGLLYAWRIARTGYPARLLTIDAVGAVVNVYEITGMPTSSNASSGANSSNLNAGDISADGKYLYLTDSGGGAPDGNPNLYVIDLTTTPPKLVATFLIRDASGNRPTGPNNDLKRKVNDFAYNRIDGLLYGADQNSGKLAILDPATGIRTDVSPGLLPFDVNDETIRYGGAWFDSAGTLYLYENVSGMIYPVTFPGGVPTLGEPIQGDPSTDVDAAACAGGPVVEPDTPAIDIEKTVYEGHDSGLSGPGEDFFEAMQDEEITYFFEITNTGNVALNPVTFTDGNLTDGGGAIGDPPIGIGDLITVLDERVAGSLAPGGKIILAYQTTASDTLVSQGSFVNTACVEGIFEQTTVDDCDDAAVLVPELCADPEDPSDGEGCTPGYWKQSQHFDSWVAYNPNDSFEAVFGVDLFGKLDGLTLLDALKVRDPRGEGALIRHAVAALLNAASAGVDYEFSEGDVKEWVKDAYAAGIYEEYEKAKDHLEMENERMCPLD